MPAVLGIDSDGLDLAFRLLVLFLVIVWFALIYWTHADARRRLDDQMLIGCATVASLFPFVGTVVYMILRPPEYLEDAREREIEVRAVEAQLRQAEGLRCSHCDSVIERDFLRCPACLRKLKEPCVACGRPLEQRWSICPYCETQVPGAIHQAPPPARARRRRREEPAIAEPPPVEQPTEF